MRSSTAAVSAPVNPAHLDGELDGETEQGVLRHQRPCPGCTAYLPQVRDQLGR